MKKLIVSLVMIVILSGCTTTSKKEETKEKVLTESEYYQKLSDNMKKDFDTYYNKIKVNFNDANKSKVLIIQLKSLLSSKVDIEKYQNYKTKVSCDKEKTYAIVRQNINDKGDYQIEVKYDCDGYLSDNYKVINKTNNQ